MHDPGVQKACEVKVWALNTRKKRKKKKKSYDSDLLIISSRVQEDFFSILFFDISVVFKAQSRLPRFVTR